MVIYDALACLPRQYLGHNVFSFKDIFIWFHYFTQLDATSKVKYQQCDHN